MRSDRRPRYARGSCEARRQQCPFRTANRTAALSVYRRAPDARSRGNDRAPCVPLMNAKQPPGIRAPDPSADAGGKFEQRTKASRIRITLHRRRLSDGENIKLLEIGEHYGRISR